MEGWDGTRSGEPSDLTRRRWKNFGISGAKLMWGGEAVAIRHDGRANPHQLMLTPGTQRSIASLRDDLLGAHRERFGPNADGDLYLGLQITHSGRFARPDVWNVPAPLAACRHPILDRRFPDGVRVLSDADLDRLIDDYIAAAKLACDCGYQFVDAKACHGYLGHELLGATTRDGKYGGPLENRLRFITQMIQGIRAAAPGLAVVVRVSIFDVAPHRKNAQNVGVPEETTGEEPGFGVLRGEEMDRALDDGRVLLTHLEALGVKWICTTAGSPYYNPHIQRPAFFPPLDGYEPPEDPLRGVARQIDATAQIESRVSESGVCRVCVQLSAGVAAACRAIQHPHRSRRLRGPRPRRAVVSRPAGRRPERTAASTRRPSAARSATARPDHAWAWCRDVIHSIPSMRPGRKPRASVRCASNRKPPVKSVDTLQRLGVA